jgi:SHS2 domain-containing protein
MPFEELSHTADWSLCVWAADLPHLFMDTAKGMNALAGTKLAEKPRIRRTFSKSAVDIESLLVSFLSELVYYAEQDRLAFDHFDLSLKFEGGQPCRLSAILRGAPILVLDKSIKAVTYHNLQIQQTARGYEVEIVFDV